MAWASLSTTESLFLYVACPCKVLGCANLKLIEGKMQERERKYKIRKSYNTPGQAHELTFTTYHRKPLFAESANCELFLRCLDTARRRHSFKVWAYVLMPDHVHLLIFPAHEVHSMAAILKGIKQPFARKVSNSWRATDSISLDQHSVTRPSGKREIRIWQQGGGYDRNIVSEKATLACVEYIHNNPFVADLADSATGYRWSSLAWYEGQEDVPFVPDPML